MVIYDYNYRVKKLDVLLSKQLAQVLRAQEIPLTDSQATLVMYLYHHQSQIIYQKNLPAILGISGPTGNGLVKRLVQKGAIRLQPDSQDGRLKQLRLTPAIIADITRRRSAFEQAFMKIEQRLTMGMTTTEAQQFQQLLDRGIANLTADTPSEKR